MFNAAQTVLHHCAPVDLLSVVWPFQRLMQITFSLGLVKFGRHCPFGESHFRRNFIFKPPSSSSSTGSSLKLSVAANFDVNFRSELFLSRIIRLPLELNWPADEFTCQVLGTLQLVLKPVVSSI